MTKKIIFVHPRIDYEDNYPCSWIPYGILSIASKIRSMQVTEQYDVQIYDENIETIKLVDKYDFKNDNILFVGFSVMTGGGQIRRAINMAKEIKNKNNKIKIVFGGPHVNVLPKLTLDNDYIDYVSCGPGQNSIIELLNAIEGNVQFDQVPGLMTKLNDGGYVCGPQNNLTHDTMVKYDYSLIDVSKYIQRDNTIASRTINYISTQGCVYSCRFCYETNYKRRYCKLPIEIVMNDIEMLYNRYNINGIKFYDADWFVDVKRATVLSDFISKFNISWAASINPQDVLRDEKKSGEMMNSLRESGCTRLLMGMESGCDRVLSQIVNKCVDKHELYKSAEIIANHGILGSYTFIIGFPYETMDEINETFNFIKELWQLNPQPETRVHVYTPYPGTALYLDSLKCGFVPPLTLEEWSDFNYYKVQMPWVDKKLEEALHMFTRQLPKK